MRVPTTPTVFAVILNWNEPDRTTRCVNSLREMTSAVDEIVVVDNGSDPERLEMLHAQLDGVTLLRNEENLGYAGGLQIGVDYCLAGNAELIWCLNNDTSFAPDTLRELLASYARNGADFIYAPKMLNLRKPEWVLFSGRVFEPERAGFRNPRAGDKLTYGKADTDLITETVSGAGFVVPATVIRKHGFMSHDYYLYFEEFDYALRLRKLGVGCICVLASVMYHEREGTRGRAERNLDEVRAYYRTRNKITFFRRCFTQSLASACIRTHVRQTLRNLASTDRSTRHVYYRGLRDGLLGRMGRTLIP